MIPVFIGAVSVNTFVFQDKRGLMGMRGVRTGMLHDSVSYLFVDSSGATTFILRRRGDEEWFFSKDNRWAREAIVFGARATAAVANEALVLGETDNLVFTLLDEVGRTMRSVSFEHQPEPIPADEAEKERARQLEARLEATLRAPLVEAHGRPVVWGEWYSEMYQGIPAASGLPAYTSLYGDRGAFWFCTENLNRALSRCSRVSGNSVTGVVDLPGEWQIHAFHDEHVLISTSDSLDRPTVSLYRLSALAQ
jgi:hypothetical protein